MEMFGFLMMMEYDLVFEWFFTIITEGFETRELSSFTTHLFD